MGNGMNQILLAVSILAIFLVAGCTQTANDPENNSGLKNDSSGNAVKEFSITAKQFEFVPSVITVNQGDRVVLTLNSSDVAHGFFLSEFNMNVTLPAGETKKVEFVADKAGTFSFRCSVPCGSGHQLMQGTLVVLEK